MFRLTLQQMAQLGFFAPDSYASTRNQTHISSVAPLWGPHFRTLYRQSYRGCGVFEIRSTAAQILNSTTSNLLFIHSMVAGRCLLEWSPPGSLKWDWRVVWFENSHIKLNCFRSNPNLKGESLVWIFFFFFFRLKLNEGKTGFESKQPFCCFLIWMELE